MAQFAAYLGSYSTIRLAPGTRVQTMIAASPIKVGELVYSQGNAQPIGVSIREDGNSPTLYGVQLTPIVEETREPPGVPQLGRFGRLWCLGWQIWRENAARLFRHLEI